MWYYRSVLMCTIAHSAMYLQLNGLSMSSTESDTSQSGLPFRKHAQRGHLQSCSRTRPVGFRPWEARLKMFLITSTLPSCKYATQMTAGPTTDRYVSTCRVETELGIKWTPWEDTVRKTFQQLLDVEARTTEQRA